MERRLKVEGSLNLNFFLANFAGRLPSAVSLIFLLHMWSGHDANDNMKVHIECKGKASQDAA